MPKAPQFLNFFEPIFFGIIFCFLPELEYFFYPSGNKYSPPMLYLFIALWTISLFIFILPLKQLIKDKFDFNKSVLNFWLRNISKRNPDLDHALIAKLYKFPSLIQIIFPILLIVVSILWLIYPLLLGKKSIYPYAVVPFFLGYKSLSTKIKYNNLSK